MGAECSTCGRDVYDECSYCLLLEDRDQLLAERDRYREALARLVALKDGPRDEFYEQAKPLAWEQARALLFDASQGEQQTNPTEDA